MLIPFLMVSALLLLIGLCIIYKPPAFLIQRLQNRWPDVLFHVPTKQKFLALTIDDGPTPCTAEIQRILNVHGAKATFFVIGAHVPGHEDTLRDLVDNGHELGNHAMRDEPSRSLPVDTLVEQIQSVESRIQAIYDSSQHSDKAPPKYFRPGSGFFSTAMRRRLLGLGYRLVLGDIYPHDPQIPLSRLNAWHILSMARPGGIIICHDRIWTAPMLRTVLPQLQRRGYRIVTVTELLAEEGR
jgi:peptidoglycan/xylan/chitin deacetylase (PgdA/CDA1 family)